MSPMSTIVLDATLVHIPPWVEDLNSFRRWARSDDFPQSGRIGYLGGEVWVDMSKEQLTHNQVKGEIASVLPRLARTTPGSRYFPDGYLLTNVAADLSTNPDGMFVSAETLRRGRARLVAGAEEGHVELEGMPDMVLEVVSQSSVHKDTVVLHELYARAGVVEYWLIDVRGGAAAFQLLRLGARGYASTRRQGGWVRSAVFRRSFRLTAATDPLGHPAYTLHTR